MTPIRPENANRYPANWPEISQRIRFERAGGRCECAGECGVDHALDRGTTDTRCINTHNKPSYETAKRVILTVAHLDHQPENCDDENLRAYCNGCHLRYDRDHHAETRAQTRQREIEGSGQMKIGEVA